MSLSRHTGRISNFCLFHGSNRLASGSWDATIKSSPLIVLFTVHAFSGSAPCVNEEAHLLVGNLVIRLGVLNALFSGVRYVWKPAEYPLRAIFYGQGTGAHRSYPGPALYKCYWPPCPAHDSSVGPGSDDGTLVLRGDNKVTLAKVGKITTFPMSS